MKPTKVAVIQAAPVFLDLNASIDKAEQLVKEAADKGAELVAFPELWLPGYPWFAWIGSQAECMPFIPKLHQNSMAVDSPEMLRLQQIALKYSVLLVMGYSEREGGSRYISQVLIDASGDILLNRRKLKPTHVERTLFGEGDGSDIRVVETNLGRIGALNCWEHIQPLVKMAMYTQHEEIHIAAWPSFCLFRDMAYALGPEANNAASQVYALEGGAYVLAPCAIISQEMFDAMADSPEKAHLLNPRTSKPGGGAAQIYAPDGRPLCEPLAEDEEGILYADLHPDMITLAKNAADPVGHYSRPDVLGLVINRQKRQLITEVDDRETFEVAALGNKRSSSG